MATVIILILNHLNVETLNISVHVEAPFAKINRTGSKMITETHQTAIDRILSFAEKDENEQAAIIKRFPSQELLLDPTSTDTFDQITFKIRSMMQKLDTSAIEMVQVRMQIAFDLKRLYDIYDDSSNTIPFYQGPKKGVIADITIARSSYDRIHHPDD
jgi:hypothetical protein